VRGTARTVWTSVQGQFVPTTRRVIRARQTDKMIAAGEEMFVPIDPVIATWIADPLLKNNAILSRIDAS